MAKKDSKNKKHGGEIVDFQEYREPGAYIEYEEDEEQRAQEEKRLKKMRVPKAVYRIAVILLILIVGLAVWVNREWLTPQNISSWVQLQLKGTEQGDGFPVSITGSSVSASNFGVQNGNALILSDTALTMLDDTGRELFSLRHSFNQPAMRTSYGKTLLYNQGSLGYMVLSGPDTVINGSSEKEIMVGAIAQNGSFAFGVQGEDGASQLNAYLADGSLQSYYQFAEDYITAVALNYDATCGAVCTVRSESGELVSKVTVFDFNREDPIAAYETPNNLLLDICWTENGDIYAVGESALLISRSSQYEFTEYSYEGRQLTSYLLSQGRAFLSVSAYEHAGPSTLLIFHGSGEPVRVEAAERIVSLSASGGTVGALVDGTAHFYDYSTGMEQGQVSAGNDAKSLALASERMAYVLGVSEARTIELKN